VHRTDEAGDAALLYHPVRLLDAPLRLRPVLNAARGHVAIERVGGEGQILRVTLHAYEWIGG
jgi:hypothetical protein